MRARCDTPRPPRRFLSPSSCALRRFYFIIIWYACFFCARFSPIICRSFFFIYYYYYIRQCRAARQRWCAILPRREAREDMILCAEWEKRYMLLIQRWYDIFLFAIYIYILCLFSPLNHCRYSTYSLGISINHAAGRQQWYYYIREW